MATTKLKGNEVTLSGTDVKVGDIGYKCKDLSMSGQGHVLP